MPRIAPSSRITIKQLQLLEQRMQAYYSEVPDYPAFHAPSHHPLEWQHVLAEYRNLASSDKGLITILEFGSGRTGFPVWLRHQLASDDNFNSVSITCQDITATNRAYLQHIADDMVIAPLQEAQFAPSSFDIIFSTHCFEHVARPEHLLNTLFNLLRPGGSLLIFAPRYDTPFYLSPSSCDLLFVERIFLSLRLLLIRLNCHLRGRPAFVIDTHPACLNRPFRRDADAIHWVSGYDVHLFADNAGLTISELDICQRASCFTKQWIIDRFCKLAIKLQKPISQL